MTNFCRSVSVFALASLALACAPIDYRNVVADLPYTGSGEVVVMTIDQRSYVLSGDKTQEFVGLKRDGFGMPHDLSTQSGKPLAADMTEALKATLDSRGFQVVPILVGPGSDERTVADWIQTSGAQRAIVLTLNEWKSDQMMNTSLLYDVTIEVRGSGGEVKASHTLEGSDALYLQESGAAEKSLPLAFGQKMQQLLTAPDIQAALR